MRERVARAWHEGSDHADYSPFGGPLCNCWQVAGRIMPMLRDAWGEGEQAGMRRADWEYGASPNFPKPDPYEEDQ